MTAAYIQALAQDGAHRFSKQPAESLTLITGLGVKGDAAAALEALEFLRAEALRLGARYEPPVTQ